MIAACPALPLPIMEMRMHTRLASMFLMTTIRLHGQDPAASETVSFSVIVKLPKTYRYDVDPDLL